MFNTLHTIDPYHGYWIKSTVSETLPISKSGVPVSTPLRLAAGWNLVSYLPSNTLPVTQALASIAGKYTTVLGFDEGATSYYTSIPPRLNTLAVMEPHGGYWIKMTGPDTLVFPGVAEAASTSLPVNRPQSPVDVTRTNEWINVYSLTARSATGRCPLAP